ncbi:hypothetical protein HAP41_0000021445 [Bradyrhizobium barranii subsp. apii]|uniref:Uncharacterized protein n=1 Tax=Bradyrhizobium barranii subsp. apii TaxID=2819348 RepID=A0A8T5VM94_9BRAD|nr:hypothetical protein [Bradyrhizobium barranii]UPT91259.1 hypothetical protein HAP41_0000021445 [Bradyrhizobium barranii subsp. apii]
MPLALASSRSFFRRVRGIAVPPAILRIETAGEEHEATELIDQVLRGRRPDILPSWAIEPALSSSMATRTRTRGHAIERQLDWTVENRRYPAKPPLPLNGRIPSQDVLNGAGRNFCQIGPD